MALVPWVFKCLPCFFSLALYYYLALSSAHKKMIALLKEQLILVSYILTMSFFIRNLTCFDRHSV